VLFKLSVPAELEALIEISVLILGRLAPQKHQLIAEMLPSEVFGGQRDGSGDSTL